MKFVPKEIPPKPLAAPLREGRFKFVIVSAVEGTSKSGNHVIRLKYLVRSGNDNRTRRSNDVISTHPNSLWKVKSFCDCMGIDYTSGEIDVRELYGATGEAHFIVKLTSEGRPYLAPQYYISAEGATNEIDDTRDEEGRKRKEFYDDVGEE